MKAGRTLRELAEEIDRQARAQADYVAPATALTVRSTAPSTAKIAVPGEGAFEIGSLAHRQIGEYAGVPAAFYDRMLQAGETLATPTGPLFDVTLNTLFAAKPAKETRRLVRTLDGRARAFLSDGYRPMGHYEIMEQVLPVLMRYPRINWGVSSMDVTESRLYLRLTNDAVQGEVKVGDVVQSFVEIANSETGQGAFSVTPGYLVLLCLNGAKRSDLANRKYHTGGRLAESDNARFYADETLQARNRATILEMGDLIDAALSGRLFNERILPDLKAAAGVRIEGDPVKSVERVANKYALNQDERAGVLRHLVEGADLSLWGLSNAVTRAAQDVPSYDRSVELEGIGGAMIVAPRATIREIVEAR